MSRHLCEANDEDVSHKWQNRTWLHVRERVSWSVHGMARSQAGEMLTTTMVGVAASATQGSKRERIFIQALVRGDVLLVCVVFGSWRCKD